MDYAAELSNFWLETWGDQTLHPQDIFDQLIQHYQEPQRHYHTTQHLYECLLLWREIKALLQQPCLVARALWFHDVVVSNQSPR